MTETYYKWLCGRCGYSTWAPADTASIGHACIPGCYPMSKTDVTQQRRPYVEPATPSVWEDDDT